MTYHFTGHLIVCWKGYRDWKHHSSASVAFVRGIHRWPVNSPHKGPVTRILFPFDDVIIWVVDPPAAGLFFLNNASDAEIVPLAMAMAPFLYVVSEHIRNVSCNDNNIMFTKFHNILFLLCIVLIWLYQNYTIIIKSEIWMINYCLGSCDGRKIPAIYFILKL